VSAPYYEDASVTLWLGRAEDVLPTLEPVAHVITDPPYSEHTHKSVRSAKMQANDRGGRYGSDVRRNVDLGFDHLTPELRALCAEWFARLAARWTLVFSDVESDHLWRDDLTTNGLDYVRTGAWHKVGSTPQFSGDRPATAFEAITICHQPGRKRWNGGGGHALWSVPIVLDRGRSGTERLHPTQKPEGLIRALVDQFTDPGETILDAFAGSGTLGVVAAYLGRKAVLIEQSEAHCEVAAKRLVNAGDTLFGEVTA
jgi:site-specific DNA-methyltransferase (adenine-specific)